MENQNRGDAMFSVSIHFGPSHMCWTLLFKTEEAAAKVLASYTGADGWLTGTDDFGQTYAIACHAIHGVLLEDMEAVEAAQIHRSLAAARARAKLNIQAKSDPTLRQAAQGPGVLSPMGGRFNG